MSKSELHFAERHAAHLRFVHFVLVIVTSAVFVASSIEAPGAPRIAIADLVSIAELAEQNLNDQSWLHDHITDQIARELPTSADLENTVPLSPEVGDTNDAGEVPVYHGFAYVYPVPSWLRVGQSPLESTPTRDEESESEALLHAWVQDPSKLHEHSQKVTSLIEFKQLWNTLSAAKSSLAISEVSRWVLVIHANGRALDLGISFLLPGPLTSLDNRVGSRGRLEERMHAHWIDRTKVDTENWRIFESYVGFPNELPEVWAYRSVKDWESFQHFAPPEQAKEPLVSHNAVRVTPYSCNESRKQTCMVIVLPLIMREVEIKGLQQLRELADGVRSGILWREGSFAEVFPELDIMTSHIKNLPLGDLISHLREQVDSRDAYLDAFGLSISTDLIAMWGPATIAATLLYFLLHLRRFNSLNWGSLPIEFPWVGLYAAMFPQFVLALSVVVWPAFVALFVGYFNPPRPDYFLWTRVCIVLVTLILSAACGLEIWKLQVMRKKGINSN